MRVSGRLMLGASAITVASLLAVLPCAPAAHAQSATPTTATPTTARKPATHRTAAHRPADQHPGNDRAMMVVTAGLTGPRVPHTVTEALVATYLNDPQLLAERAKLRATD